MGEANLFLSHKEQFSAQAEALEAALGTGVPGATVFRMHDIDKGAEWREMVHEKLDHAKCLVLLYASPEEDWSWCFYEAGRFARKGHTSRPLACLHPEGVKIPSPLANLQGITGEGDDIRNWLKGEFFRDIRSREPRKNEIDRAASKIKTIVNTMPAGEKILKPYIWITPKKLSDWNADGRKIDFSDALVEVEEESAGALHFAGAQKRELLPFLREMACDTIDKPDKVEFWITKFFESLQGAVRQRTNFQEEAYFRHETGKILRPVVVSYAKCASGMVCRLRVIFAETFGSPLTDSPDQVQRLSIGARLAIRSKLEIIDPFMGHLSQMQEADLRRTAAEGQAKRNFTIGGRLIEALRTIFREAESHGVRPEDPAPKLFDGLLQQRYEDIRHRGIHLWKMLEEAAKQGDHTGDYSGAERLLAELEQLNEDYLALVLPRIHELLVPADKRQGARQMP